MWGLLLLLSGRVPSTKDRVEDRAEEVGEQHREANTDRPENDEDFPAGENLKEKRVLKKFCEEFFSWLKLFFLNFNGFAQ